MTSRSPSTILTELLVLQAQDGDREALSQLVETWHTTLFSRAYTLTQSIDASKDITQESWLSISKGIRTLRDPERFGPWAMRIVQYKSADWIRSQSKQRENTRRIQTQSTEHTQSDPTPETDLEEIRYVISHLEPKLRDVIYAFYLDRYTLDQIACALDIPIGTAKSRLHRAREQLKSTLERNSS